jgi:hypothetical protein
MMESKNSWPEFRDIITAFSGRPAPDLDHFVDPDEMIGLSRRHKDTKKNSLPERRRPRRHQHLIAMTLRQLCQTSASKCGANSCDLWIQTRA